MSIIQRLPSETLDQICGYLVSDDDENWDLESFSCTCKHFRDVGFKYRCSSIHLQVLSRKGLTDTVKFIEEGIGHNFQLIRKMTVTGRMTGNSRRDTSFLPMPRIRCLDDGFEPCGHVDADGSISHVPKVSNCLSSRQSLEYPQLTSEEYRTMGEAWGPLVEFIRKLPNLDDLAWLCNNQVPCTILDALHEHSLRTRLHVHFFNPGAGAWRDEIGNGSEILLRSPCLSTIVLNLISINDAACIVYLALMSVLKVKAPNLRSVSVWGDTHVERYGAFFETLSNDPDYQSVWELLKRGYGAPTSSKRTSLDTLVTFSPRTFALWTTTHQVDWLRDLTFTCQVGLDMMRQLTTIVMEYGGYPSLEALRLRAHDDVYSAWSMDNQLSVLLKALHPLKTLELAGLLGGNTFDAVLDTHGQSLKRLRFEPALYDNPLNSWRITEARIRKMVRLCPHLESLDMQLHANMNDNAKIKACQALGRLPRLRHICLDMAFETFSPPNPRKRYEERYLYEENPGKRVLATSNKSGKSALAIFKAIGGDYGPLVDLRIHAWRRNMGSEPIIQESDLKKPFWVGYTWVYQRACGGSEIYFREIVKRKKPFYPASHEMPEDCQARATREVLVEAVTNLASKFEEAAS